jgi:acyl transferase domain-containing protein/acyl carrier protein
VSNLRAPVLFSGVTQRLINDGHLLFVELSPHPILLPAVEENLLEKKQTGASIASLRRSADERRSLLDALGTLHARGRDIDWKKLFPTGGQCVALPAYPWQRERYWIDPVTPTVAARTSHGRHPLLGPVFRPSDRPDAHYWERWLSVAELPYLADHRVRGEVIFPGAGYVEMALAAAEEVFGEGGLVLDNLSLEWFLSLPAGSSRLVQIVLRDEQGERGSVDISSRDNETSQWVLHARATVRDSVNELQTRRELPLLVQQRCPTEVDAAAHYARMDARQIEFGPAFRGVERIWVGTGEALGKVRLPEQAGPAAGYAVHPALLDACLQVATVLVGADEPEVTFVPASIDRLYVHHRLPDAAWVRVSHSASVPGADGAPALDIEVLDEDGRPLIDLTGLRVQRLGRAALPDPLAECAYSVVWHRKDLPAGAPAKAPSKAGVWLVFGDEQGCGAALAQELRARGDTCVEVEAGPAFKREQPTRWAIDPSKPEDYQRLLRETVSGDLVCRGVVHLWSLDTAPWESTTGETLLADLQRGSLSALYVVQALGSQGFRDAPRLMLVTRGAQAVDAYASLLAVAQAPLWGLGRTIAMEQPDLACTRVDLAPSRQASETTLLLQELLSSDGEDQIALRDDGRHVARLQRGDLAPTEAPSFNPEASYLITGGLGGLGLSAARWMVAHGARHLHLVGRSQPSDEALLAIRAMEESGAEVRAWRADVSRLADVEGMLETMHESLPPLRGVVHAAGVLDDRTLQSMTAEQFSRPMIPKAIGAWNLHTATRGIPLDFFVMYSSAAALLGSPGQGNYAAANTFLDALAHARAAEGLPAMSIQWGSFSEVGLAAAQENRGQRLESRGIDSFTPEEGTALLSRLIQQPWGDVGLFRISVRQWIEFYPRAASAPFLAHLREEEDARGGATKIVSRFQETLANLSSIERRAALERHVFDCLARVLHLPAERIDAQAPLRGYGMDSLMSLEIRNRLEVSLGLRLSASLLYTYSTPVALVEHLLGEMVFEVQQEASVVQSLRQDDGPSIQFFELSEKSAMAMLDEKLLDLEDYLK